ncbi:hypothetical protein BDF22DRAFT_42529 [Syncephalis plumigaleata]|nr:hypothetical protein BDF22DRAFT_42529 [Syncephalis plumigaleata]
MSLSPINGGSIIQFPRTHGMSMTLGQSTMPLNSVAAAHAAAHAVSQQRMVVADNSMAKRNANNAQKRANHNAIERARRECLNSKFQELAHSIPSLSQVRRPSKSVIVQKSLEYIYSSKQRTDMRERELRSVKNENVSLREEVDRLRRALGLSPLPERPRTQSPEPEETADTTELARTLSSDSSKSTGADKKKRTSSNYSTGHDNDEDSDELSETGHSFSSLVSPQVHTPSTPTAGMFASSVQNSPRTMGPTSAGSIPGFLDYMHGDINGGMSPVVSGFVSPLGFPTQAVHPVMDMYSTPLSIATTAAAMAAAVHAASPLPHQQIFLPSPSEDVFNMNELMMSGCIDQSNNGMVSMGSSLATSNSAIIEPQQIQTPPLN